MKLIYGLSSLVLAAIFAYQITESFAAPEPVCRFKSSQEEMVFLQYFRAAKKGEVYVDFGTDGKCFKRATCTETFRTEVEECKNFPVTCENKKNFNGVFPACCVKC